MLKIWTGRIGYRGTDGLDITVKAVKEAKKQNRKSKGSILAPTETIVYGHKAYKGDKRFIKDKKTGRGYEPVSDEEYLKRYRDIVAQHYSEDKAAFIKLLSENEEITLLCYCAKGAFCHRHRAASILEAIAKSIGIEVKLMGER